MNAQCGDEEDNRYPTRRDPQITRTHPHCELSTDRTYVCEIRSSRENSSINCGHPATEPAVPAYKLVTSLSTTSADATSASLDADTFAADPGIECVLANSNRKASTSRFNCAACFFRIVARSERSATSNELTTSSENLSSSFFRKCAPARIASLIVIADSRVSFTSWVKLSVRSLTFGMRARLALNSSSCAGFKL